MELTEEFRKWKCQLCTRSYDTNPTYNMKVEVPIVYTFL
jgi:hypothetical protein